MFNWICDKLASIYTLLGTNTACVFMGHKWETNTLESEHYIFTVCNRCNVVSYWPKIKRG